MPLKETSARPLMRNGVSASVVVLPALPAAHFLLVIDFLCQRFPHISRAAWHHRMQCGDVLNTCGANLKPDAQYVAGEKIFYFRAVEAEPKIPFEEKILFQDDLILVADKPHFLPVTPSGGYVEETLLARLKKKTGIETLSPIHRIDQDTAGLVVFCIQPKHRGGYQKLFAARRVKKTYEAIAPQVHDRIFPLTLKHRLIDAQHFMQMQIAAENSGPINAISEIDVIETQGKLARYSLRPTTGARHQLRVQMASIGAPILNDRIYPVLRSPADVTTLAAENALSLLAQSIRFQDPITNHTRQFCSAISLYWPYASRK